MHLGDLYTWAGLDAPWYGHTNCVSPANSFTCEQHRWCLCQDGAAHGGLQAQDGGWYISACFVTTGAGGAQHLWVIPLTLSYIWHLRSILSPRPQKTLPFSYQLILLQKSRVTSGLLHTCCSWLYMHLCIHLSSYLSVYLSVYLSIYLYTSICISTLFLPILPDSAA